MSVELVKPDTFFREIALADSVPALAKLVRKADTLVDYMRKAGHYDIETVQEFSFYKGEAVRRAGAMLEEIAPERPGRKGGINDTSVVYFDTLKEAELQKRAAEFCGGTCSPGQLTRGGGAFPLLSQPMLRRRRQRDWVEHLFRFRCQR